MAEHRGKSRVSRSTGRRSSILKQDTCILEEGNDGFTEGSRTPKRVSFASTATVRTFETVPWHMINSSASDDNNSELTNTLNGAEEVQDDVFVPAMSTNQPPVGANGGSQLLDVNLQDKANNVDMPANDQNLPLETVLQQDHTIYFSNLDNSDNALELTANLTEQEIYNFPHFSHSRLDRIPSFSNEQAADGEDNSIFFNLPPAAKYPYPDIRSQAEDKTAFFDFNSDNGMEFTCHDVAQQDIENAGEDMEMTGEQNPSRSALVDITSHQALTPIEEMSVVSNSLSQGEQEPFGNAPKQKLNFSMLRARLMESNSSSAPPHEKENWPMLQGDRAAAPITEIGPGAEKYDNEVFFNFHNQSLRNRQMTTTSGDEPRPNALQWQAPQKGNEILNCSEHEGTSGRKLMKEMAQKASELVNLSAGNILPISEGDAESIRLSDMSMDLTHCIDVPEMNNYASGANTVLDAEENESRNKTKSYLDISGQVSKCVNDESRQKDKDFDNPDRVEVKSYSRISMETDQRRSNEGAIDKTRYFPGETMDLTVNISGQDRSGHSLSSVQTQGNGGAEMNISSIAPRRYEERTRHFDTSMDVTNCYEGINQNDVKTSVGFNNGNQMAFRSVERTKPFDTSLATPSLGRAASRNNVESNISFDKEDQRAFRPVEKTQHLDSSMDITTCGRALNQINVKNSVGFKTENQMAFRPDEKTGHLDTSMDVTTCGRALNQSDTKSNVSFNNENQMAFRTVEKTKHFDTSMDVTTCGRALNQSDTKTNISFNNENQRAFRNVEKTKHFDTSLDVTTCGRALNQSDTKTNISFNNENQRAFRTVEKTKHFDTSMDVTICGRALNQSDTKTNVSLSDENQRAFRTVEKTKHFDTSMDITTCGRALNQNDIRAHVCVTDESQKTLTNDVNIEETQQVTENVNGFVSEKVLHFPNTEMEVVSFTSYNSPNVAAGRKSTLHIDHKRISPKRNEAVEDNFENILSQVTSCENKSPDQHEVSHVRTGVVITFNSENVTLSDKTQSNCRMEEVKGPQCLTNSPELGNTEEVYQGDHTKSGSKVVPNNTVIDSCVSVNSKGNSDMERKKSVLRKSLQKDLFFSLGSRRISSAAEPILVSGKGGKYFSVESQAFRRTSQYVGEPSCQPQKTTEHEDAMFSSNTEEVSKRLGYPERNQTTTMNHSVLLNPLSPASSQCVEADISRLMESSRNIHSSIHKEADLSTHRQKSKSSPENISCQNSSLLPSSGARFDHQSPPLVPAGSDPPSFSRDAKTDSDDCLEDSSLLVDETMPDLLENNGVMPAIESFDDGKEAKLLSYLEQSCFAQGAESNKEATFGKNTIRDIKISDIYELLGLHDAVPLLQPKSDVTQCSSTNSFEDHLGVRMFQKPRLTCLDNYVRKLEEEVRRTRKALSAVLKQFSQSPPSELLAASSAQQSEEDISERKSRAQMMSRTGEASAKAHINKLQAEYLLDLTSAQQNEHVMLKTELSSILSDNKKVKQLRSDVDRRITELDQLSESQAGDFIRGILLLSNIASLRSQSSHLDGLTEQTLEATSKCHKRKSATEEEKALLAERLGWMACLSEWTILKNSSSSMSFGFLSNTVVVNVKFVNSPDLHRQITDISVESRISADNPPLVHLTTKWMIKSMDIKSLRLNCQQFGDLSQLLNRLSEIANFARDLFKELRRADLLHRVNFEDCKMRIKICDHKRTSQVEMETDLIEGLYPHHPLKWTVQKTFGSITASVVQTTLETVVTGEGYLMRVLEAVSSVLNQK